MITITEDRYKSLLADEKELQRLRNAGVDNWSGYDYDEDDTDDESYSDIYGEEA